MLVRTLNRVSETTQTSHRKSEGCRCKGEWWSSRQNHSWAPEAAGTRGPQVALEALLLPVSLFCPSFPFPFLLWPCILGPWDDPSPLLFSCLRCWSVFFWEMKLSASLPASGTPRGENSARMQSPCAECTVTKLLSFSLLGLTVLWNFILEMRIINVFYLIEQVSTLYNVGRCLW